MKNGIHPEYHTINVVMTDGTKYQTRSTWGKEGDVMTLDVDSKSHPAWQKDGVGNLRKTGQMEKFNSKFSGITFGKGAAAGEAKKEEAPAKKEEKAAKPAKKEAAPKEAAAKDAAPKEKAPKAKKAE